MNANDLIKDINNYADPIRAQHSQRFFKTGPGQYGEGDIFIGITMPQLRGVCRKYRNISQEDLRYLLQSLIHEHRMAAVVIMSDIFLTKSHADQKLLYDLYLEGVRNNQINNWDIIDVSAKNVVGMFLKNRPRDELYKLAKSDHLWSKRVAMVCTPAFFVHGDIADTLSIAEILLQDKHDLIQKAVGWMLREVGKYVDESVLTDFLDKHAHEMPRTMLRYSIERLSSQKRAYYMNLKSAKDYK